MSDFWKTSISQVKPNEVLVRGYPIEELATRRSFGDVVYLLMTGELPPGQQGQLIEMILIVCCEHSLASPSVDAVRFVASSGVPLQTAVAAGVSAIGEVHGGAIEPCARLLKRAVEQSQSPAAIFAELKSQNARLPGFGHPVHSRDPRVVVLLETAESWNIAGVHTRFAKLLEGESNASLGKHLPMNVDGAIAALMCDMKIDPALGKAFFIIGRAPGYVAHAFEQMTRERPFKAPAPEEITYTGPAQRAVPPPSRNQT
jgi:citrate synthase